VCPEDVARQCTIEEAPIADPESCMTADAPDAAGDNARRLRLGS
jgi:hypothetical protein